MYISWRKEKQLCSLHWIVNRVKSWKLRVRKKFSIFKIILLQHEITGSVSLGYQSSFLLDAKTVDFFRHWSFLQLIISWSATSKGFFSKFDITFTHKYRLHFFHDYLNQQRLLTCEKLKNKNLSFFPLDPETTGLEKLFSVIIFRVVRAQFSSKAHSGLPGLIC